MTATTELSTGLEVLYGLLMHGRHGAVTPLSPTEWRKFAADTYAAAIKQHHGIPKAEDPWHKWGPLARECFAQVGLERRRDVAAALCARAKSLGYDDQGQLYADRFFALPGPEPGPDDEPRMAAVFREVLVLEKLAAL